MKKDKVQLTGNVIAVKVEDAANKKLIELDKKIFEIGGGQT